MQPSPVRDLAVGLFAIAGFAAIGYLSLRVGGLTAMGGGGLELHASFDAIGDLDVRSPVTISGVKVGQVVGVELSRDMRARVRMDLRPDLELPVDSFARIRSESLLGGQFVELQVGAEDEVLGQGDEIPFTEGYVSIENLVGKLVQGGDLE